MRKCAEASSNHQNVISIDKVCEICIVVEKNDIPNLSKTPEKSNRAAE